MRDDVTNRVLQGLETLPEDLQRQVLDFVQALQLLAKRGVPGEGLLQLAGTIPADDLDLMRRAIEQDCERLLSWGSFSTRLESPGACDRIWSA